MRTKDQILKYVPKSKLAAIEDAWEDGDGMWITLKAGWNADRMDFNCHTIHEDTVSELRFQIAGIRKKKPSEMTVREYDEMMENEGANKVWVVRVANALNGMIDSKVFLDEEEEAARRYFDEHADSPYSEINQEWDIWHYTERRKNTAKAAATANG